MIPLVKIKIPEKTLKKVNDVLKSGNLAEGQYVKELEKKFAQYCGVKYCRAVANGTVALSIIMACLGIKEGDGVIVPTFSFIATANCVLSTGARPIFADIDEKTFTIDLQSIKKKISKKVKAIIPVHLFGQPARMDCINEFAAETGCYVIEDACQSHGAIFKGKKVGSLGDAAAFSLYPTKNLICGGEGGLITTNNKELYEKICLYTDHGQTKKYYHTTLGYNFRLDEIRALIALDSLQTLDTANNQRRKNAAYYNAELSNLEYIEIPYVAEDVIHVYHQYAIKSSETKRAQIIQKLKQNNIACAIHYPCPIHRQPYYAKMLKYNTKCPVAEKVSKQIFSIPVHPYLSSEDKTNIVKTLKSISW
jgi:perosamine synthetase